MAGIKMVASSRTERLLKRHTESSFSGGVL